MYLRDISLGASSLAKLPRGRSLRQFNVSAQHVQEIFLVFMPSRYSLDGAGKLNIDLGPRGDEPTYLRLGDVSVFHYEGFAFGDYFALRPVDQAEMILAALEQSALAVAKQFSADPAPIRAAANKTRANGFELRYYVENLSKLTRSRKVRLRVFRHIRQGGESWGIDVCDRNGEVRKTLQLARKISYVEAATKYYRSALTSAGFRIMSRSGARTFEIDSNQLSSLEHFVSRAPKE